MIHEWTIDREAVAEVYRRGFVARINQAIEAGELTRNEGAAHLEALMSSGPVQGLIDADIERMAAWLSGSVH